jgi:putative DNA primase/helicase
MRPDPLAAHDATWMAQRRSALTAKDAERPRRTANGQDAVEATGELTTIATSAPYSVAKTFVDHHFRKPAGRLLHHHRGSFFRWGGARYFEIGDDGLRARLYEFLDGCSTEKGNPVKPSAHLVNNILDGLRAVTYLDCGIEPPAWLDAAPDLAATDIVPCRNGLLHLPSRTLAPLTPCFFALNGIDFDYQPNAPAPAQWLGFLTKLWKDDPPSVETLQEIFGFCLTYDTGQEKAFLIVGPKRSGKGTIGRIMRALVGPDNTAAPTLAGLGTNFGLAPLIGKRLAIISDARLGGRADHQTIAERLLSITGEDAIDIDRKYRASWSGRLQTRFVILTNELPRVADASGALASRFIVLTLLQSFFGREDLQLTNRLLGELPGILNWAIDGLDRLRSRGHFVQPASSADAIQALEDLSSPVGAFLRDCCQIGTNFTIERSQLYRAWCDWCEIQGLDHTGPLETFGKNLRAALPAIKTTQPHSDDGKRRRFYQGVGLRWQGE